jgi:hypothetical protein
MFYFQILLIESLADGIWYFWLDLAGVIRGFQKIDATEFFGK